jgi:hypothetical protein
MLQWLRNRIWRKRRLIFRFHDGHKIRSIDPVEVVVGLHGHSSYLHRHLGEAANGDADAQRTVAQAACDVFGVHPFDSTSQTGLTVAERIELVMAFDLYMWKLKKNTGRLRTPPQSTASTSPASSEPITNDTSDSGSTETDPQPELATSTASDS